MKRYVILTVGKTHSGKTTFARMLEEKLENSVVIDQDNHAEFIHYYYQKLLPDEGPNTFKYSLTQTIVDYAINETDRHLILCNANRHSEARVQLLDYFHSKEFTSLIVNFDIPLDVLKARVSQSKRSTNILRSAMRFEEVLERQTEVDAGLVPDEADHFFVIKDDADIQSVIKLISNKMN